MFPFVTVSALDAAVCVAFDGFAHSARCCSQERNFWDIPSAILFRLYGASRLQIRCNQAAGNQVHLVGGLASDMFWGLTRQFSALLQRFVAPVVFTCRSLVTLLFHGTQESTLCGMISIVTFDRS